MPAAPTLIAVDPEALEGLRREVAGLREELAKVTIAPKPDWVTVPEYARMIGRTEGTVLRKVSAGTVEAKHVGGVRMVRV